MPTLTEIEMCEPPVLQRDQTMGPSIDLDHRILRALRLVDERLHPAGSAAMGRSLGEITQAVGGTTHHVHARVQTLIDRGLVIRERIPGGPRRGPGASQYLLTGAGWCA